MDVDKDPVQLPNPHTPMAFLNPELAYQLTIAIYVHVGTLSVLIWDLLNNFHQDLSLAKGHPLRFPTVSYFLSRLACLGFVLFVVVAQTAPLDVSCLQFGKAASWFYAPAVSTTSLLFLIRLRAIFDGHPLIRIVFSGLWLVVLAACLTPGLGLINDNIGTTKYCVQTTVEPYVGAATIVPLINDTLVFLAISWKLMGIAYDTAYPLRSASGLRFRVRAFFRGDYLPAFSRGLLQDGQVYYLTTVTTNLMVAVVFHFPSVPAVYQSLLVLPNVTMMNIMACRVYRRTKQARYKDPDTLIGNLAISRRVTHPLAFATIPGRRSNMNGRYHGDPMLTSAPEALQAIERRNDDGQDQGIRTYLVVDSVGPSISIPKAAHVS